MAMIRAAAAVALLVVLATALHGAQAQCPSTSSLLSCQSAVTAANVAPTAACCARVQQVLNGANGAKCLCDALTSPLAVQFKVIKAQAVLLPSKCAQIMGLKYTKNFNCAGTIVP